MIGFGRVDFGLGEAIWDHSGVPSLIFEHHSFSKLFKVKELGYLSGQGIRLYTGWSSAGTPDCCEFEDCVALEAGLLWWFGERYFSSMDS